MLFRSSERDIEPVFIWPVPKPTAKCAIVTSSVSPERWLITVFQPASFAICTTSVAGKIALVERGGKESQEILTFKEKEGYAAAAGAKAMVVYDNVEGDGSVKVTLVQKPDLSKKGITKAVLEFSVDGIDKKSKAIVMVNVKNPVSDIEEEFPEVEVDSKVIEIGRAHV